MFSRGKIKMKRLFPYILLTTLTIVLSTASSGYISAESIDEIEGKISEYEKEQQRLEDEQGNIGSDKQTTEGKIEENITQQDTITEEITSIDEELTTTQSSIQTKEAEIVDTNEEIEGLSDRIEKLKKDVKKLQKRIEKRESLLKDRLISIQKSGGSVKYIEVILGSQSFGDFISRVFAVNTIMDQDKNIMEEHETDKDSLENKQVEVEEKREEVKEQKVALESQKDELVALKTQLDNQMAEKETLIAQLEEEHGELEEYKLSLEEEEQVLSAEASAIAKAKQLAENEKSNLEQLAKEEAARKKAAEEKAAKEKAEKEKEAQQKASSEEPEQETPPVASSPPASTGNGTFIVPTTGRTSSPFGYRTHPIFGDQRLHAGIDFAAPSGTPVVAAGSGVVSTAGYMNSYGNVIMISHYIDGKTYTTLYAHLSSISVSPGQTVNQGENIGNVGSTGDSTGPHLHFEVHPGGYRNPVNPAGYF